MKLLFDEMDCLSSILHQILCHCWIFTYRDSKNFKPNNINTFIEILCPIWIIHLFNIFVGNLMLHDHNLLDEDLLWKGSAWGDVLRVQTWKILVLKLGVFRNIVSLRSHRINNSSVFWIRNVCRYFLCTFLIQSFIKEDNFIIKFWFTKWTIFNEITEHWSFSQFINERIFSITSIFWFSKSIKIKEVRSFNWTDFSCVGGDQKLLIILH